MFVDPVEVFGSGASSTVPGLVASWTFVGERPTATNRNGDLKTACNKPNKIGKFVVHQSSSESDP